METTNDGLERLIVMVHGAGLNAGRSFETGNRIADALGESKDKTMVIAPQFLEGIDPNEKGLLNWDRTWRSGGLSISAKINAGLPVVSSYDVMDTLVRFVAEKHPNINIVFILGHSAGGQFVARYAAVNNHHEDLHKRGVAIHYVVANPTSYLYLDADRYQMNASGEISKRPMEELAGCPDYNNYKYGLDNPYGYAGSLSRQDIRARLTNRPVIFLLGSGDIERGWYLDKSCAAELQGKNRFQKGLLYKHHLTSFTGDKENAVHHWMIIPGVGHEAREMFTHPTVVKKLEAVSKPHVAFENKARPDEKAAHIQYYVSILKKL